METLIIKFEDGTRAEVDTDKQYVSSTTGFFVLEREGLPVMAINLKSIAWIAYNRESNDG